MVTYKQILLMGEALRKSPSRHLTLKQITDVLVETSGSFHGDTIKSYLKVLVKQGYIKSVAVDGAPMWEILQKEEK
jgi:Fe2+ or Zn2+ uptake regulation protein